MAERRMFAKVIVDSDLFLDMPLSTQALYFHLGMRADDAGFVNSPKKIQRMVGASGDDLKLLEAKGFIIPFESGVVVITHWRNNNYIQKDRYKETIYLAEKSLLEVTDNGSYNKMDTECIQNVSTADTQVSIGKDSKELIVSKDTICQTDVRQDIEKAVEAWNALEPLGYSKISRLSSKSQRYQSLKARISEYGIEDVLKAIDNVRRSSYLVDQTWFAFDWFVKPNNFPKVLEGKYNSKADGIQDEPTEVRDDDFLYDIYGNRRQ